MTFDRRESFDVISWERFETGEETDNRDAVDERTSARLSDSACWLYDVLGVLGVIN